MWPITGLDLVKACGVRAWPAWIEPLIFAGVSVGAPPRSDELFVALREGGYDSHDRVADALDAGAPFALVSADWSDRELLASDARTRCLVVADTLRSFRALASFLRRRFTFPVVAVGGSNGKTTTKEMIAAMLSDPRHRVSKTPETMNGWTGLPLTLTQRAHEAHEPPHALVVEIGIDAVGAMAEHARLVDPDVAVLTALGDEHLAGLGSREIAASEEMKLFDTRPEACRIFHVEDAAIGEHLTLVRDGDIVVCATSRAAGLPQGEVSLLRYEVTTPSPTSSDVALSWSPRGGPARAWSACVRVPVAGRHNGENFALAFAAGLALGRAPDELVRGFATFVPPSMRCEVRALANGCVLVDDAYNASPASLRAALDLLAAPAWRDREKVAILGDMLDLGAASERLHLDFCDSIGALVAGGARVCLVGSAMREVHAALARRGAATWHVPDGDRALELLDAVDFRLADAVVLVKGSRGMHLETVVSEIARQCVAASAPARVVTADDLAPFRGRFSTACVTGARGKTATTSLLASIVDAAGEPVCKVTTLGAEVGGEIVGVEPTGDVFVRTLALASERGARTLAIETTAQALSEGFARAWPANVAVFTNFAGDPHDLRGTPEDYLAAMAQLFMGLSARGAAIFNVADPASALLDEVTPPEVRRLGYAARSPDPDCAGIPLVLRADEIAVSIHGTRARLVGAGLAASLGGPLDLRGGGAAHVENALAAALAGLALGYSVDAIVAGLSRSAALPKG